MRSCFFHFVEDRGRRILFFCILVVFFICTSSQQNCPGLDDFLDGVGRSQNKASLRAGIRRNEATVLEWDPDAGTTLMCFNAMQWSESRLAARVSVKVHLLLSGHGLSALSSS